MPTDAAEKPHTLIIPADLFGRLLRAAEAQGREPDRFALDALSATATSAATNNAVPQNQSDRIHNARALIAQWQEADNTPVAMPAPNDGKMTLSQALFWQWEQEDDALTEAEREAQAAQWEQFQQGINAERAASGMRLLF